MWISGNGSPVSFIPSFVSLSYWGVSPLLYLDSLLIGCALNLIPWRDWRLSVLWLARANMFSPLDEGRSTFLISYSWFLGAKGATFNFSTLLFLNCCFWWISWIGYMFSTYGSYITIFLMGFCLAWLFLWLGAPLSIVIYGFLVILFSSWFRLEDVRRITSGGATLELTWFPGTPLGYFSLSLILICSFLFTGAYLDSDGFLFSFWRLYSAPMYWSTLQLMFWNLFIFHSGSTIS